jgi:hypothetical protein
MDCSLIGVSTKEFFILESMRECTFHVFLDIILRDGSGVQVQHVVNICSLLLYMMREENLAVFSLLFMVLASSSDPCSKSIIHSTKNFVLQPNMTKLLIIPVWDCSSVAFVLLLLLLFVCLFF